VIQDFLLEPIRKLSFLLQKDKEQRWYSRTHLFGSPGKTSGEILFEALVNDSPKMISRMGTSELHIILNYLARDKSLFEKGRNYINGSFPEFWWGSYAKEDIFQNSGFFSIDDKGLEKFSQLYLQCIPEIDVLLTWLKGEEQLHNYFSKEILKAYLYDAEPYFDKKAPWTGALEGKKVLVIHPFEESIKDQYKKRTLLFADNRVLPDFELKTIRAFQTIKGNITPFNNWFDALEMLKDKIAEQDFDIALIAAGSYGLPLAAHVKSLGKKGVHLGGFLQLIFGIRGRRWEDCKFHAPFINEHWKFPYEHEHPLNYKKLDNGSYW